MGLRQGAGQGPTRWPTAEILMWMGGMACGMACGMPVSTCTTRPSNAMALPDGAGTMWKTSCMCETMPLEAVAVHVISAWYPSAVFCSCGGVQRAVEVGENGKLVGVVLRTQLCEVCTVDGRMRPAIVTEDRYSNRHSPGFMAGVAAMAMGGASAKARARTAEAHGPE